MGKEHKSRDKSSIKSKKHKDSSTESSVDERSQKRRYSCSKRKRKRKYSESESEDNKPCTSKRDSKKIKTNRNHSYIKSCSEAAKHSQHKKHSRRRKNSSDSGSSREGNLYTKKSGGYINRSVKQSSELKYVEDIGNSSNTKGNDARRVTSSYANPKKSCDHHSDSESAEDDDINFSYEDYRHELNKIFFRGSNLVHDIDDFWLFVKKYEIVEKRAASKNVSKSGK